MLFLENEGVMENLVLLLFQVNFKLRIVGRYDIVRWGVILDLYKIIQAGSLKILVLVFNVLIFFYRVQLLLLIGKIRWKLVGGRLICLILDSRYVRSKIKFNGVFVINLPKILLF